jgi:hypothetical protein
MKVTIMLFFFSSIVFAGDLSPQMERIINVFNELRKDNLQILDNFYAKDVKFLDPLGVHDGIDSVKKYYANLYENVEEIKFEYMGHVSDKNNHVYLWKMKLKTPSIKNGEEIIVIGNSHITFDEQNLVSYHRDYFDMGEFVYENVPALGWVIRKIKSRMKAE